MPLALKVHHAVHLSLYMKKTSTSFGIFLHHFLQLNVLNFSRCHFQFLVKNGGTFDIIDNVSTQPILTKP